MIFLALQLPSAPCCWPKYYHVPPILNCYIIQLIAVHSQCVLLPFVVEFLGWKVYGTHFFNILSIRNIFPFIVGHFFPSFFDVDERSTHFNAFSLFCWKNGWCRVHPLLSSSISGHWRHHAHDFVCFFWPYFLSF